MKWLIGLMFICVTTGYPKRDGKSFSLFSVVSFKNEECTTTMDPAMNGLCVSSDECGENGGTASGNCASGFGVCCFHTADTCTAANTISHNVTYLQNENFPTAITTALTCTYNIQGASDICQIRIDYDNLVIAQPALVAAGGVTVGQCGTDTLTVGITNGATTSPLCGTLSGQHMYFDTGRALGTAATVTITTVGTATSRTWKIKVRTLECSSSSLAGAGCLQWFTGNAGRIQSLNSAAMTAIIQRGLNYRICIRDEKGSCGMSVRETNPGGAPDSFLINEAIDAAAVPADAFNSAGCALGSVVLNGINYCGGLLAAVGGIATQAAPVDGGTAPYQIGVVTSNADLGAGHMGSRFDLTYSLTPCA